MEFKLVCITAEEIHERSCVVFEVDCPTKFKLHPETFEPVPLQTRILINDKRKIRVIWTPCSKHCQEVKDAARDRMDELVAIWDKCYADWLLRKNATMDERTFSPESGSTRLI